jgi:hypothetical protein
LLGVREVYRGTSGGPIKVETWPGPLHKATADISVRPSALKLDNAHGLVFKHDFYLERKNGFLSMGP